MRKISTFIFTLFIFVQFANAQTIVSYTHLQSYTQAEVQAQLPFTLPGLDYGVDAYSVQYNTIDPFGNPTVASGAIYIPSGCTNFPLVSYQHGTVLLKTNVPSVSTAEVGFLIAAFGFACSAPDFLGLGSNPGPHPYIHAESQATASVDLMRATRDFLTDTLTHTLNNEVYLMGYSQGGHATMALHKYIEDNALLSEFDVRGSSPMAGPFDLAGVQMDMILDSSYSSPAYITYVNNSYQYVYGNLYNTPSDYYKSPYDNTIPPLLDGTHSLGELNAALPNNVFLFMEDSVTQNIIADSLTNTHPLRAALNLNSNYDWLPTRPIRMAYCDGDEQVNHENSIKAKNTMIANGATQVEAIHILPGADHGNCALPALLDAINWFRASANLCTNWAVNTNKLDFSQSIRLFPNPTTDRLTVQLDNILSEKDLQLEVVDLTGKILKTELINQQYEVNLFLGDLNSGVYFIRISNDEVNVWKKVVLR